MGSSNCSVSSIPLKIAACLIVATLTFVVLLPPVYGAPISALAKWSEDTVTHMQKDSEGFLVEWYPVEGESLQDIYRSFKKNAPTDNHSSRRWGMTRWSITWTRLPSNRTVRSLDEISLTTAVTMKLPLYKGDVSLDSALATEWQRFFRALILHERQHVDLFYQGTRRIHQRAVSHLGANGAPFGDLIQLVRDEIADIRRGDVTLDHETDHGTRDGVILNR